MDALNTVPDKDLIVTYDSILSAFAKVTIHVRNEKDLKKVLDALRESGFTPAEFEDVHQFVVGAYNSGRG